MTLDFLNISNYKRKALGNESEPIVAKLIDRKDFIILSATAKTGKSMLALHMGISVASGNDFLGFSTQIGKVLYLQTEVSTFQQQQRLDQMLQALSEQERQNVLENLYICDDSIRLDTEDGIKSLQRAIVFHKPSLLILDPFYTLHRKREDSSDDMAPILTDLKTIAKESDCALLLIHHQGKRSELSASQPGHNHRGSSSFADVPDASLSLSKKNQSLILKGEFRNRESLEPVEYTFDNKSFEFALQGPVTKRPTAREFILLALENPDQEKRTAPYLKAKLKHETGLGPESFNKAIQQLKIEEKIEAFGRLKGTYYSLKENSNT